MRNVLRVATLLSAVLASACATTYQKSSITGGFSEMELDGGVWRIGFAGNGYSSYETVQTYWLYRCAEVALEKNYAGFEILSDIRLTMEIAPEQFIGRNEARMEKTQVIYMPMNTGPFPEIEADIKFLRAPVTNAPPKVFDAAILKQTLDPIVNGKKCSGGNVCPHAHKYIYGEGKTQGS